MSTTPIMERLNTDKRVAMKGDDKPRLSIIRQTLAKLEAVEIDARPKKLDAKALEELYLDELKRFKKQIEEEINEFKKANRTERVAVLEADLKVLISYLPEQMTEDQIAEVVAETKKSLQAEGKPVNIGTMMGKLSAQLKGKADNKLVKELVEKELETE